MSLNYRVHEYAMNKETGKTIVHRSTPYVRVMGKEGPPIYLQTGKAYYADGSDVEEFPYWFSSEFDKLSKDSMKECGWDKVDVQELNISDAPEQPD